MLTKWVLGAGAPAGWVVELKEPGPIGPREGGAQMGRSSSLQGLSRDHPAAALSSHLTNTLYGRWSSSSASFTVTSLWEHVKEGHEDMEESFFSQYLRLSLKLGRTSWYRCVAWVLRISYWYECKDANNPDLHTLLTLPFSPTLYFHSTAFLRQMMCFLLIVEWFSYKLLFR